MATHEDALEHVRCASAALGLLEELGASTSPPAWSAARRTVGMWLNEANRCENAHRQNKSLSKAVYCDGLMAQRQDALDALATFIMASGARIPK